MSETLAYERRTRRAWLPLLVAAVVLAVAAAALDARRSDRERSEVDRCAKVAVAVVSDAESRLTTMARYIGPVVDPPKLKNTTGVYSLLSRVAEPLLPDLASAELACQRIAVWQRHTSIRRARDRYVALLAAERTRLEGVVADGRAFNTGYDDIVRLLAEADRALRR
jgi:hypothetical protein